jgi:hypothetical protein
MLRARTLYTRSRRSCSCEVSKLDAHTNTTPITVYIAGCVHTCSVDDRTPAERGEDSSAVPDDTLAGGGVRRLLKSRYDSISTYLHYCKRRADNPMHVSTATVLCDKTYTKCSAQYNVACCVRAGVPCAQSCACLYSTAPQLCCSSASSLAHLFSKYPPSFVICIMP